MQVLWGDALLRVEEGLSAGRRWLWDEASRKVGALIAAPSAFQGEHFLQVKPLPCRNKDLAPSGHWQRATGRSQPFRTPCVAGMAPCRLGTLGSLDPAVY